MSMVNSSCDPKDPSAQMKRIPQAIISTPDTETII